MQPFTLDPTSPVPLTVQFKEQLRLQIRLGLLKPGARLPGLRELARRAGLNRNTVIHAIAELEAEGYVYSEHGRGVFVADRPPGPAGTALRTALEFGCERAATLGVPPADLALSLLAYSQLAPRRLHPLQRVLVVAGHRRVAEELRAEVESALPVFAEAAVSDELPAPPALARYRLLLTTLFHAAEIREAVARSGVATAVVPLSDPGAEAAWDRLRTLGAAARLVVVAPEWVQAGRVRRSLMAARLEHLDIHVHVPAPRGDPEPLRGARAVLYAARRERVAVPPPPEGAVVVEEPSCLLPAVADHLRRLLDVPPRPPRPGISPWF